MHRYLIVEGDAGGVGKTADAGADSDSDSDSDSDANANADADADVDIDIDVNVDVDIDAEVEVKAKIAIVDIAAADIATPNLAIANTHTEAANGKSQRLFYAAFSALIRWRSSSSSRASAISCMTEPTSAGLSDNTTLPVNGVSGVNNPA